MKSYDFLKNINKKIRPGDDFFSYVNSNWIKRNPIPADRSRWAIFNVLADDVHRSLKGILDSIVLSSKINEEQKKLRDLFLSGMNEKKLNSEGAKPIKSLITGIETIDKKNVIEIISQLHKCGIHSFWGLYLDYDDKDSSQYILRIGQSGLSLPDREYYLAEDKKSKEIRKKYLHSILSLSKLSGFPITKKEADAILEIETRLARASLSRVEIRDANKQYNEFNLFKLIKISSKIGWEKYFKKLGFKKDLLNKFLVNHPTFIKEVNNILENSSLDNLKVYLKWRTIVDSVGYLSEKLVKERFKFFGKVLSGAEKIIPRWKRTLLEIDHTLGDVLGKLYVEKFFPSEAKKRMNSMIDDIFEAYEERIKNLDWMSPKTKKRALQKLSLIDRKIGYTSKWENYSSLKVGNSYIENHWQSEEFYLRKMIKKLTKKKVDRREWHMSAPTVNAYYSPNMNEIVFPAGILQPPSFDLHATDAMNYGGIGSVIGHELTHGFDDEGSKFDHRGNLIEWWTKKDRKLFTEKAKNLVKQYDACEVLPGRFCNGKLTLGENIADLGGLTIAFDAFKRRMKKQTKGEIINGFTPEQQFFIAWAREWSGSIREGQAIQYLITDPHSPLELRVNQVVNNLDAFYEAFGVKPGDKLYRKPKDRVKIW